MQQFDSNFGLLEKAKLCRTNFWSHCCWPAVHCA